MSEEAWEGIARQHMKVAIGLGQQNATLREQLRVLVESLDADGLHPYVGSDVRETLGQFDERFPA